MISSREELRFFVAADRVMAGKSPKKNWKEYLLDIIYPDYILNYLRSMRHVAYHLNCKKKGASTISYLYHKWNFQKIGAKLGFSIGPNVFGYGLLIPHYGTIVVNNKTKAGRHCVLHTSTCIGGAGNVIGDALYLASGAMIMGPKVMLSDNVSVAANSMVNKSFSESNILLAGTPASVKTTASPWYERDGHEFGRRVAAVEQLKQEMKITA
jgi:serine O-acetyltransferase